MWKRRRKKDFFDFVGVTFKHTFQMKEQGRKQSLTNTLYEFIIMCRKS